MIIDSMKTGPKEKAKIPPLLIAFQYLKDTMVLLGEVYWLFLKGELWSRPHFSSGTVFECVELLLSDLKRSYQVDCVDLFPKSIVRFSIFNLIHYLMLDMSHWICVLLPFTCILDTYVFRMNNDDVRLSHFSLTNRRWKCTVLMTEARCTSLQ